MESPLPNGDPQTLNDIISRMAMYSQWHDDVLMGYEAQRKFHASSQRFNMNSTLEVETVFRSPESLFSTVLKQEGSSFVREQVFEKILHTEKEAASRSVKGQLDIIPQNYQFGLIGMEDCAGRRCWHLVIKSKRKDKYLLDGSVWVDASDYAICRVQGTTSKKPSLWVSQVQVDKRYRKIDQLWLTEKIESAADVMLAGRTTVTIETGYGKILLANSTRSNGQ